MQVDHLFDSHIYIITNHAVARNLLFRDKYLCRRFLEKLDKYLSSLCQIMHYCLDDNQFQIIVKLRDREAFIEYYIKKYGLAESEQDKIPASNYIFSQAMANLQSSTAIHFNRSFGRTGALFARRFQKVLVKSKEELDMWIDRLNEMKKFIKYYGEWGFRQGGEQRNEARVFWMKRVRRCIERTGYAFIKGILVSHAILSSFIQVDSIQFQGQFIKLPPGRLYPKKNRDKAFKTAPSA